MSKFTLEVCADSVESVLAAEKGGADRIELCGNVVIGGTTPSESLFREIRRHSDIKIHALIRPRFGDFCYTEYEFDIIRSEVRRFRELGAQGVVIGMLRPDGSLDVEHLAQLMEEAKGMSVTLHRAFDVCRDPMEHWSRPFLLVLTPFLHLDRRITVWMVRRCLQSWWKRVPVVFTLWLVQE
mgnify:FL=1